MPLFSNCNNPNPFTFNLHMSLVLWLLSSKIPIMFYELPVPNSKVTIGLLHFKQMKFTPPLHTTVGLEILHTPPKISRLKRLCLLLAVHEGRLECRTRQRFRLHILYLIPLFSNQQRKEPPASTSWTNMLAQSQLLIEGSSLSNKLYNNKHEFPNGSHHCCLDRQNMSNWCGNSTECLILAILVLPPPPFSSCCHLQLSTCASATSRKLFTDLNPAVGTWQLPHCYFILIAFSM